MRRELGLAVTASVQIYPAIVVGFDAIFDHGTFAVDSVVPSGNLIHPDVDSIIPATVNLDVGDVVHIHIFQFESILNLSSQFEVKNKLQVILQILVE